MLASPADVRGKIVYGNLPLHLAAQAKEVHTIEFAGQPPRGAEYGIREMEAAGARLAVYQVFSGPASRSQLVEAFIDELRLNGNVSDQMMSRAASAVRQAFNDGMVHGHTYGY